MICDNEINLGVVHRSPNIYLTAEEDLGRSQLDHLIKAVQPVIASNGIPYLQMMSVGSHRLSGREKQEKKGASFSIPDVLYNPKDII
jgi:hypothetical protein